MKVSILARLTKKQEKIIKDYKQEVLNREGAIQFKKMADNGIEMPVVHL